MSPPGKYVRKVGGTDISKLLGMNPYGGPREVWERIVNKVDVPLNDSMRRGLSVEPRIRDLSVRTYGLELEEHPGIVQSPQHIFATASPDDFGSHNGSRVLLEYKSVTEWAAKKWGDLDYSDAVPEHYHLQVRWNLGVCGIERALLIAAFGADVPGENDAPPDFVIKWTRIYEFHRDRDIEARLFKVGEFFWEQYVVPQIPPPADPKPVKRSRKVKEAAHV